MTYHEFMALCGDLLINPAMALENESIYEAVAQKDYDLVKKLLLTEF